MSNKQKIEQQTNLLNTEWSKLRIQSIPLSTSSGALASKKVCVLCLHRRDKNDGDNTVNHHTACTAQLSLPILAQAALS